MELWNETAEKNVRQYEVQIYYSGYCIYRVKANSEEEAIHQARFFKINTEEIISNLEPWQETDIVIAVKER